MADPFRVLAGPLVRRVEPTAASVWVALDAPRGVRLAVWQGVINTGPDKALYIEPQAPLTVGFARTVRLAASLHVAVVTVRPKTPLLFGHVYAYLLSFGDINTIVPGPDGLPSGNSFSSTEDLKSLGLLLDDPIAGHPHLALGYDPGELPSFALSPPDLGDLRLLHGSCRRAGHETNDGLAWVDDFIVEWRKDPNPLRRPHQLVLHGDQIYADDMPKTMLAIANDAAQTLFGNVERLPTRFPPGPNDPLQPDFADKKRAEKLGRKLKDPCIVRVSETVREPFLTRLGPDAPPGADPDLRWWPADLDYFPAGLRERVMACEARFTSVDLHSHLMSLGEYCATYLLSWCNILWPLETGGERQGRPKLRQLVDFFTLPADPPKLWELHLAGRLNEKEQAAPGDKPTRLREHFRKLTIDASGDDKLTKKERKRRLKNHRQEIEILDKMYTALPKVRRALANIPTYMIFDDHDITDDWNMLQSWCDQVHTAALGRAVLRNALVAYLFFQAWGNLPDAFTPAPGEDARLTDLLADPTALPAEGRPENALLLLAATRLFPDGQPVGPDTRAAVLIDRILGFHKRDALPRTQWHYTIDGARHRILALDTRTRRLFRSRNAPVGLISPSSLVEQFGSEPPVPLPAGLEVLFVISATPVLQPSVNTSLVLPVLFQIEDVKHYKELKGQPGLDPDNEVWQIDVFSHEALLARLAFYRRVVVLSGEIHHAFSVALSYWPLLPDAPLFSVGPEFEAELNRCQVSTGLRDAFTAANQALSGTVRLTPRLTHDEWLLTDVGNTHKFLIRRQHTAATGERLAVFREEPPARIAQLVSSGLKNDHNTIVFLAEGFGFSQRLVTTTAERLGWADNLPRPVAIPEDDSVPPSVRALLELSPTFLPTRGWPEGTRVERPPDTTWRQQVITDERPDGERAPEVVPDPLPADVTTDDLTGGLMNTYAAILTRHSTLLNRMRHTRTVVYANNLGLVRFEGTSETLVAIQELHTDLTSLSGKPYLAALHRIPLHVFDEDRPALRLGPTLG